MPNKQYGFYIQDDWRLTDRLTVDARPALRPRDRLRHRPVEGPELRQADDGGRRGPLRRHPRAARNWARKAARTRTTGSRASASRTTSAATAATSSARGWGIYYDFGYTNANILFPGLSAQGGFGVVFDVNNSAGIRNPDGSVLPGRPADLEHRVAERRATRTGRSSAPTSRRRRSASRSRSQTSAGWSHQLGAAIALDIDYVHIKGKDLGVRWPLNTRVNLGARRCADLALSPDNPTLNMSIGESTYDGINFGIRRRLTNGWAWNAWYTLSKAEGLGGFGVDELTTNMVQDATNVFADVQYGPSQRTDARHKLTLSTLVEIKGGFSVARRCSSTGRRCRFTSGTASISTATASPTTSTRRRTSSRAWTMPAIRSSRRSARARRSTADAVRRSSRSTSAWRRPSRFAAPCGLRRSPRFQSVQRDQPGVRRRRRRARRPLYRHARWPTRRQHELHEADRATPATTGSSEQRIGADRVPLHVLRSRLRLGP